MGDPKQVLRKKFSANYKKYYLVDLFRRRGFTRKKCENCGKYFWTLKPERKRCDDQPCSPYSFIGNPPTKKRFDYLAAWKETEKFFVAKKHAIVKRYPVVSRWRPDLYFTVASIIDFQRIEGGKVVFQLPVNPLVVPQMVLRFNDVPSVGVSGKHFTSFCMIGQTSLAKGKGYWKDKCIDLDFELLTKRFGIPQDEMSFVEDVWLGYGAFGYSLEYFVRGLELGNAVFTAFEGTPEHYLPMRDKVVDMGAGLERFAWITQGTPTAYDSTFSTVVRKLIDICKVEYDRDLFLRYSRLAGSMNIDEHVDMTKTRRAIADSLNVDATKLDKEFAPLEALYAIADHARTLLFAIADGMLPSNVGGGYNLRVVFRRASAFIDQFKFNVSMKDVVNWHIDYLSKMYPELEEHREDVAKVLDVETSRTTASRERITRVISSLKSSGSTPATEDLIRLYDSDGVTPEQLMEAGIKVAPPEDFYERVLARHIVQKPEPEKIHLDISGLRPTKLLFYEHKNLFNFGAKVLRVFQGEYVVLDQTAFYPRGGGQEPDRGTIGNLRVVEVEKYGDIVIHKVVGTPLRAGRTVKCQVDGLRRNKIMRIHTATHILNGSSRDTLGSWVWQHSAFKEEDYGRLDITHFAHLTREEVQKIESLANSIVRKDLTVNTTFMPKKVAEEKYGFRLYQGGVVPTKTVRVVNIGDWDFEACGGTHADTTGQVGLVKITRTERIQDGVERIEFVAGDSAIQYIQQMEFRIEELSSLLGTQKENVVKAVGSLRESLDEAERREKALVQKLTELAVPRIVSSATPLKTVKVYVATDQSLGEEQIIAQGSKAVIADPFLVYLNISLRGSSARVVCFVGEKAKSDVSASDIVKRVASELGGSGGGSPDFAQGGGPLLTKVETVTNNVTEIISSLIRG
jgi:alanyl-tRNA synthetase